MQNPYSKGDYVDCKHPSQGWCVARIIEIKQDTVKVRFDGMTPKNDATIKFNHPRLALFRRHTAILVLTNPTEMMKNSRLKMSTKSPL